MVTLLFGPFFGRLANRPYIFLLKKPSLIRSPVNTANFFWPISDHINGVPLYFQINQQSNLFWLINQQTSIIFSKKTLPVIYVRSRSKPSFWYLLLFCDIYDPQQKKQTISFHFTFTWSFQPPTRNYNFHCTSTNCTPLPHLTSKWEKDSVRIHSHVS